MIQTTVEYVGLAFNHSLYRQWSKMCGASHRVLQILSEAGDGGMSRTEAYNRLLFEGMPRGTVASSFSRLVKSGRVIREGGRLYFVKAGPCDEKGRRR